MDISFAAETLFSIGAFHVTNSFLTSIVTSLILISFAFYMSKQVSLVPSGIQNLTEIVIQMFYDLNESLAGSKVTIIFPWFATFFLFIITANWFGLLPGVGTIGFHQMHEGKEAFVSLFRPVNSDLNVTLVLALVSLVLTHFYSIKLLGIKEYLGRYFNWNPINLFVGLLELVSEFTKVASLSFRLFGNVFAGEALLHTISTIAPFTAFIIPLPFMALEILVGFIQALIFSMLTLVFMVILTTKHSAESH